MLKIIAIPAFTDNYIWVVIHKRNNKCAIIDPGDANPVLEFLDNEPYELAAILITHHHMDHIGGVKAIKERYPVPVYGPATEALEVSDIQLYEGDIVGLAGLNCEFRILDIPGHTAGHIAYVNDDVLFCGDTLFAAGCGRLFEGTPGDMLSSLTKLAALPNKTQVYCAHEYTLANLRFAVQAEPQNGDIKKRLRAVERLRNKGKITLPSSIALERNTNPFLRARELSVKAQAELHVGHPLHSDTEVFRVIREWKDNF